MKNRLIIWVLFAVFLLTLTGLSHANTKEIKVYKKAFEVDKAPKCIACHVAEKPKKDDGNTELNEYGKKVQAVKEEIDEESFKAVGPIPQAS